MVNKHPLHKPNASSWEDRVAMAKLTLEDADLPFLYEVVAVNNPLADDFTQHIDCKVTGIDSLLDDLQDTERVVFALKWPLVVLSIPGIPKQLVDEALGKLPETTRSAIMFEYVSEHHSPLLNFNFDLGKPVDDTIVHSSHVRSGQNAAFLAPSVRTYIQSHDLYVALRTKQV